MRIIRDLRFTMMRIFCFLAILGPWVAKAHPEDGKGLLYTTSSDFSSVAETAIPAVVFIHVEKAVTVGYEIPFRYNDPFNFFGDEFLRRFFGYHDFSRLRPKRRLQRGQGSGFITDPSGYILTNHHVIGDADRIVVRLHDRREFEARLVGTDPQSEVAVIKIEAEGLPVLPLGDSNTLKIGEWVVAVGNPFGLAETLTVGVVSAKGRSNVGIADYENFIQTDAAINPGNSGGPLLNVRGEAVGINTAIYSRSGGYMGIGFAVPIDMAKKIKAQLIRKGRVDRGYLGISVQDMDPRLAKSLNLNVLSGVLVSQVDRGSPAQKAGLRPGDVIVQLNGRKVERVSPFRNELASSPPGTKVELTLIRYGRLFTTEMVIALPPKERRFHRR